MKWFYPITKPIRPKNDQNLNLLVFCKRPNLKIYTATNGNYENCETKNLHNKNFCHLMRYQCNWKTTEKKTKQMIF